MAKGRRAKPSDRSAGIWFAHIGVHQSRLESITSSALKQIHDSGEAQYLENQLPLGYRARAQKAVNNNFPFSSHDNRHSLENVGEYFDSGLGWRKVEPERRQHNSQNFFLEAQELVPNSKDGLTTYQTSYVKHENAESASWRRYPKHTNNGALTNLLLRLEKNLQPNEPPELYKHCGSSDLPSTEPFLQS